MEPILNDPVVSFVFKIIMAFLVGALIGLERERTRIAYLRRKASELGKPLTLPGIRSFGLLSLYGLFIAYIPQFIDDASVKIISEVFLILVIYTVLVFYIYRRTIMAKATGITTYIVMSLSLILGFLVGVDKVLEAIATSTLVTLILAIKPSIEKFVTGIEYKELLSGLELALFVFVLGPFFLIGHPSLYGIDISKFYLLFVIILGLSYFSYIAVKLKGSEALRYIAFLGGLVNSEAAASNIASVLDKQKELSDNEISRLMREYLLLIIWAMIIRNLIVILVLAYPVFTVTELAKLVGLLILFSLIPMIYSARMFLLEKEPGLEKIEVTIMNPLSYRTALKVIFAYSIIFTVGYITSMLLPPQYLVFVAFIGGLVNAGAMILTFLALAQIMELSHTYVMLLILIANAGAVINKLLFIRTVTTRPSITRAAISAITLSMISAIASIIVLFIIS